MPFLPRTLLFAVDSVLFGAAMLTSTTRSKLVLQNDYFKSGNWKSNRFRTGLLVDKDFYQVILSGHFCTFLPLCLLLSLVCFFVFVFEKWLNSISTLEFYCVLWRSNTLRNTLNHFIWKSPVTQNISRFTFDIPSLSNTTIKVRDTLLTYSIQYLLYPEVVSFTHWEKHFSHSMHKCCKQ